MQGINFVTQKEKQLIYFILLHNNFQLLDIGTVPQIL